MKLLSQIVCLSWTNGHVVLGNYGTSSQEKLLLQIIVARVTITLFLFVKQSKNDNHMFYCLNKMIGITWPKNANIVVRFLTDPWPSLPFMNASLSSRGDGLKINEFTDQFKNRFKVIILGNWNGNFVLWIQIGKI